MSKIKFTAPRVLAFHCKEGKTQVFHWDVDTDGLGVRVMATGTKSYVHQAKLDGKSIRTTIGDVRAWTLDEARKKARELQAGIDNGKDPRQEKADRLEAAQVKASKIERDKLTLGMVWPRYVDARRAKWSELHIRDHVRAVHVGGEVKLRGKGLTEAGALAALLNVKLSALSGKRIAAWLEVEAAKRPAQAALSYRLLSVFVNWCDSQEDLAAIVPAGACKAKQVKDELPRGRTKEGDCLQKEQLPRWFAAVRGLNNPCASAYLQGLLLTGARRRELGSLRWDDVNFEWNSLTIRDKVEGERTIPLTPYYKSLLLGLLRRNEWVFSSPSSESGQLVEPTAPHRRALLAADLPHLTLHGLRRSFNTLSEWTEAPTGVVAQIMGHKPSAISERHYKRRPIDLLRVWHTKIEAWFLEAAGIDFQVEAEPVKLRVVA
jgi:integrase